jgi:8-oxo-dGTP diphosphatase
MSELPPIWKDDFQGTCSSGPVGELFMPRKSPKPPAALPAPASEEAKAEIPKGVSIILFRAGRFAVSQRISKLGALGLWQFAGGQVEFGETTFRAAQRELIEETGLNIPLSRFHFIGQTGPLKGYNGGDYIGHRYGVVLEKDEEPACTEPAKATPWSWATPQEVLERDMLQATKEFAFLFALRSCPAIAHPTTDEAIAREAAKEIAVWGVGPEPADITVSELNEIILRHMRARVSPSALKKAEPRSNSSDTPKGEAEKNLSRTMLGTTEVVRGTEQDAAIPSNPASHTSAPHPVCLEQKMEGTALKKAEMGTANEVITLCMSLLSRKAAATVCIEEIGELAKKLESQLAALTAERDAFYHDYRVKCDTETRALQQQVEALNRIIAGLGEEKVAANTALANATRQNASWRELFGAKEGESPERCREIWQTALDEQDLLRQQLTAALSLVEGNLRRQRSQEERFKEEGFNLARRLQETESDLIKAIATAAGVRIALDEIASQKLTAEMDPDAREHADYETGYNECVKRARTLTLPADQPKQEESK